MRTENWRSHTALYFASFVALGLMTAVFGPTLPALASRTQSSVGEISFIFTALSLGYMIGSLVGGRLFDLAEGNRAMAFVLAVSGLMTAFIPLATSLGLLIAIVLILGLMHGALDVGGNTLLILVHGSSVGPFMNALHFSFGVGAFISPIIVAESGAITGGDRWAYWSMALLIAPVVALLARAPGPEARRVSEESEERRHDSALVFLIAVFLFLYVGAEVGFGWWLSYFALAEGVANAMNSAYLTSAFWGALTVGRLLGVPVARRFSPQRILALDLAGCLISLSLVTLWPASAVAVWAGAVGVGLSMASIFSAMLSLAGQQLTVTAQTTGRFILGASAGSMTLPWLAGQFFQARGPQAMMAVMIVALIAASIIFAAINLRRRAGG